MPRTVSRMISWNSTYSDVVISPSTNTVPVVVGVSHATRASVSLRRMASRIASLIWSHILSGWPSVTDSEVNRYCSASTIDVIRFSGPLLPRLDVTLLLGRHDVDVHVERLELQPGDFPVNLL